MDQQNYASKQFLSIIHYETLDGQDSPERCFLKHFAK